MHLVLRGQQDSPFTACFPISCVRGSGNGICRSALGRDGDDLHGQLQRRGNVHYRVRVRRNLRVRRNRHRVRRNLHRVQSHHVRVHVRVHDHVHALVHRPIGLQVVRKWGLGLPELRQSGRTKPRLSA